MYDNWAEHRGQLDRMLELERALARQRRQQQWQRFVRQYKRLHVSLMQPWLWRRWWPRLTPHS
jgi:hypothetical protein